MEPLTDEQKAGIASHKKEMEERCKRILEKYAKPKEPKIKAMPVSEGIKKKKTTKSSQTKLF